MSLLFVFVCNDSDLPLQYSCENSFVPTRWLVKKMVVELSHHQAAKQLEFFHALSAHSETHLVAGGVFEEIVDEFLVHASSISDHCYR